MNLKLLALYNLILTVVLTMMKLSNSHSSQDVTYALSFAPMVLFFGLITLGKQAKTLDVKSAMVTLMPGGHRSAVFAEEPMAASKDGLAVANIDKRAFIKLIGAAGISFFLFSIFSKRSEIPFFENALGSRPSSLKNSAGSLIDPAEKQSTDGYNISEIDDGDTAYYGFTNGEGAWYIMKEEVEMGSVRYVKGGGEFPKEWANRESLNYDYFSNVF